LRVLDERGQVDCSMGSQGESAQTVRDKVETARALESLPQISRVPFDGGFSDEQLTHVTRLADGESDSEWAQRAPNIDPQELARRARNLTKPTPDNSRARFAARDLQMRWNREKTMLRYWGELPDEMGARFEAKINAVAESLKVKGEAWTPFGQRAADALLTLCDPSAADEHAPSLAALAGVQVAVPLYGPAEIAGIPIADSLLEQLRANATITPVLVDDEANVLAIGRAAAALSPKVRRAVLLRDTRCRVPGCSRRRGLEVHHLVPRSWDGNDEVSNLAAVCPAHHRLLVPHGLLTLLGNPNVPDGLELVTASRGPP
jgi:hypothetical protein